MKDAFERRALLLPLGMVSDAIDKVLAHSASKEVAIHELAATHRALARLPLLRHVSGEMTAHEFTRRASAAFAVWPAQLLEAELNREHIAAVVRDGLFAANDD